MRPGLHIVLADALRPGDEVAYHPGEACLRMADVIVVTKVDSAPAEASAAVLRSARRANPRAPLVRAALEIRLDDPAAVRGRRALVVEDGPTLTHGGMAHGAGLIAARRAGAGEIIDPRACAAPEIMQVYAQYPHIGPVLPALGYSPQQLEALRLTLEAADAEVIVAATPVDLASLLRLRAPVARVRYEFRDLDTPGLAQIVDEFAQRVAW